MILPEVLSIKLRAVCLPNDNTCLGRIYVIPSRWSMSNSGYPIVGDEVSLLGLLVLATEIEDL